MNQPPTHPERAAHLRRGALLLGALVAAPALLAGCGFRPVYAPDGTRNPAAQPDPSIAAELAAVRVAPIGERVGQLARRALQRRLEDSRPGTPARYELQAAIIYNAEVLGYRRDGTVTRVRYVVSGNWVLLTDAVPPEVIDRGIIRTLDAYNIPDLQFLAADASREATDRRIIEELTDRMVLGVATALRRRLRNPTAAPTTSPASDPSGGLAPGAGSDPGFSTLQAPSSFGGMGGPTFGGPTMGGGSGVGGTPAFTAPGGPPRP